MTKTGYLYTGGEADPERLPRPSDDDLCIAADSGLHLAERCGIVPAMLVGDLDSVGDYSLTGATETVTVPAEKDDTDTMLAFRYLADAGCREIWILGGLGGRLDHTLSTLSLLEHGAKMGIDVTVTDGNNRVRLLENGSVTIRASAFRYFSLITLDRTAEGVSITGAKYPLTEAVLSRDFQYAVSNEVVGDCATVTVRSGSLLIIESGNRI